MSKITILTCDRCGKNNREKIEWTPMARLEVRTAADLQLGTGMMFDLCDECYDKLRDFICDCHKDRSQRENTNKKALPLIRKGFSSHDAETIYECPYCQAIFGDFSLRERDGKEYCPRCEEEVTSHV